MPNDAQLVNSGPPLIPWASRGAGAIGMVTALLYLGLILGQDRGDAVGTVVVWFVLMVGAGLLAWFADRAEANIGRRMVWGAFALFFVLGVLSIFTIGVLYLLAAVLSVFSLSRLKGVPSDQATERGAD